MTLNDTLITLTSLNNNFKAKTLNLTNSIKIGRKSSTEQQTQQNGIFNSKILSRQHAEIYEFNSIIYIKDLNSSNETNKVTVHL